jgi:transposase
MIRIEFTPEEIDALEYERYYHPDPKVQKKMEVLYLKSQGLEHQEICRLGRISKTTLTTYLKQYQDGGLERLKEFGYSGPSSELDQHAASLEAYFKEHPPRTTAEARQVIQEQTGLERSPTQVQAFMKRLGMQCRKVGYVPGRAADPDKQAEQETFKTQQLGRVWKQPRRGNAQCSLWTRPTSSRASAWRGYGVLCVCLSLLLLAANALMCSVPSTP